MTKTFEAEPTLAFEPRKPGKRRSYTAEQKRMILEEADRPRNSISAVARHFGLAPSLVSHWKRQRDAGGQTALAAGEPVVAESEAKLLKARVRELERLLGKKTMEVRPRGDRVGGQARAPDRAGHRRPHGPKRRGALWRWRDDDALSHWSGSATTGRRTPPTRHGTSAAKRASSSARRRPTRRTPTAWPKPS